jgi:putative chitinase
MAMDNITSNNNSNFYWWFGVVEDRNDPLRLGRCRVRIIGYHTEDNETLPTEDLPWAMPVMPSNSAGTSGVGWSPTGAVEGSWVVGFFADGENGQHPMFFGTVGAIPGGLSSNDCSPSEGSGSTEDAATSSGSSDSQQGDIGAVTQPSGNAKDLESYLESWLDLNGSKLKNYSPVAKAMIMAQCSHETGGFKALQEMGKASYFSRYENTNAARQNGNTSPGDGAKYKGRGFLQLTWKNNYRSAGKYIGKDLLNNPDLAAQKEIAAELILFYFNTQRPKIGKNNRWGDILEVSMAINGYISEKKLKQGKEPNGYADRKNKFAYYKKKYKV